MSLNQRVQVSSQWLMGLTISLVIGSPTPKAMAAALVCAGADNPFAYAVICAHGPVVAGDVNHPLPPLVSQDVPGLNFWDVSVSAVHTDSSSPLVPADTVDFTLSATHLIEPDIPIIAPSALGLYTITAQGANQVVQGGTGLVDHSAVLPGHVDLHFGELETSGLFPLLGEILSYEFRGVGLHCIALSEPVCPEPPEFPTITTSEPTTSAFIFLGLVSLGFINSRRSRKEAFKNKFTL